MNNIFAELKTEYEFLSRVEKRIADVVLHDPKAFIESSMAELSERTGVSQGSINNFARKFSAGGFSALKLKVAGHLSKYDEQPFAVIDRASGVKAAMEIKIKESLAAFRSTLERNSEESLKHAVKMILNAKRIELYGTFNSALVAQYLCYRLIALGIPSSFFGDTLMRLGSASVMDGDSLVIAVSLTGRTKEILDAVALAKKSGASVLCLTGDRTSPIAKLADELLLSASSGISISDANDEQRLAQFLTVDTLCAYIRSITDADGNQNFYKMQKILSAYSVKD